MELTVFVIRKISGQQQAVPPGLVSLDMSQRGVSVLSVAGSCRNVPINTLHLQGFVHFPTETAQRERW